MASSTTRTAHDRSRCAARTRHTIGRRLIDMLGPSAAADHLRRRRRRARDHAGRRHAGLRHRARPRVATASSPSSTRARDALAVWRSDTTLTVTLSATTGFVVLILGFAFHWQATRAREADLIYDTVRSRIDTALNRGRCGLWDWDLARGRIFWSHSMFAILGLQAARRSPELRRGQCAGASRRHPALRARRAACRRQGHFDRPRISACATPTANGSGCARAASWCSSPARPARI